MAEAPVNWYRAKRYIGLAFALYILIFVLPSGLFEADKLTHTIDDFVMSAGAIGVLAVFLWSWGTFSFRSHPEGREWMVAMFGVVVIGQLVGIAIEWSDKTDLGNDYPLGIVIVAVAFILQLI